MLVSSVCPSPFILTARPVLAFNSPFLLAEISSVNWIFETDLSFIAAIYSSQLPTCLAWLWEVLASFLVSSFVELETLLGFVPYVLVESFESALLCGLSEEVSSLLVANKDFGACTSAVSCSGDLFASSVSSFALFISLEFSVLCSDWFSSTVFSSGAVVDLEACVSAVSCSGDSVNSFASSAFWLVSTLFSLDWFTNSSAFASFPIPKNNVAPTRIEAVPTVNLLIEYLFCLFGIKSNLFFNTFTPR